jgi:hypothetical protein
MNTQEQPDTVEKMVEHLEEIAYNRSTGLPNHLSTEERNTWANGFIEGYKTNNSLVELEKVKKIEDWLREYPIDGGAVFVKDLLEYIQLIKH